MSAAGPVRVFVMEDHDVIRTALVASLGELGPFEVVGSSDRVLGTVDQLVETATDLALLDLHMPDGSGIDVCREARAAMPALRCVILTSREYPAASVAAREAGASAFLLKTARIHQLGAQLEEIMSGATRFD